jgi:hypothetical protein
VVCKDASDPQKVGGAITYFRRYSLLCLLGLTPEEDDDGNAAARPALTGQQRYDHARKHGKDPLTNDAPLWSQIDDAIKREANPDEWKRIAPNAIHIPCRECGHASTCRTEGYCQVAAAFQSKERPAPAPPAAPVANGSRPDPDQVIAILGEMDDAREPWHEIKRYADEQSTGRGGDDQLRIHDKLQAIAKRRRESVKPPASIAG